MLTPGGHRRFNVAALDAFSLAHARGARNEQALPQDWHNRALAQTREDLPAQHQANWLQTLGDDARAQHRAVGRKLMALTLQYLSAEQGDALLAEARAVGREYAVLTRAAGTPLTDALQATLFFVIVCWMPRWICRTARGHDRPIRRACCGASMPCSMKCSSPLLQATKLPEPLKLLHQLNAVAKRILHKRADVARQGWLGLTFLAAARKRRGQILQQECWMRLARRREVFFFTKMQLLPADQCKPCTPAPGQ